MASIGDRLARLEQRYSVMPENVRTKVQRDTLVRDALVNGSATALLATNLTVQQRAVLETAMRLDC